jgi:AraC-like DNA-binding protein
MPRFIAGASTRVLEPAIDCEHPHLSFSEIALLLGYSELSAFSRAVRRWTGRSPRSWRTQFEQENVGRTSG